MNNKQEVLKILDKYRDMRLTEDVYKPSDRVKDIENKVLEISKIIGLNLMTPDIANTASAIVGEYQKQTQFRHLEEQLFRMQELLNAPTPLTLLKALGNLKGFGYSLQADGWLVQHRTDFAVKVPDVTTLTEIPEEHEMWQAVLDVLI